MTDVFSRKKRSEVMSKIRCRNTKPELILRKLLFARGFRYRVNCTSLPGKPDILLPRYKTVIMVNGCFWHGHTGCRYFVLPKTRTEFWSRKIAANKLNDAKKAAQLRKLGWRVLVSWECIIKRNPDREADRLERKLKEQQIHH
jgi:DNA mismatch endonuclease (patch repair protein)